MCEFAKRRVSYVNEWPDAEEFEAEKNFRIRCDGFHGQYGATPFLPMKAWDDDDRVYQIYISRLIDALEMMPYCPNRAFAFLFSGFDYYSEEKTSESNITKRLKRLTNEIYTLSNADRYVDDAVCSLFKSIPMSAAAYIFKRQKEKNNVFRRLTHDENDHPTLMFSFMGEVKNKYEDITDPVVLRKAAAFLRIVFSRNSVIVNSNTYQITNEERLTLLISGLLYTLRNDSLHGSSISATKSSQTTVERYALNYYAFLALYTIASIMLIHNETADPALAASRYSELKDRTDSNISNMRLLFGNHLTK